MSSGRIVITLSISAPESSPADVARAGQAAVAELNSKAWMLVGAAKGLAPIKLPKMALSARAVYMPDVEAATTDPLGIVP